MAYTLDDLVQSACERLDGIGDGQAPIPESAARVRKAVPGILADLAAREIYGPASGTVFESGVFEHLASVVAATMATRTGISGQTLEELQGERQAAEQKLRYYRARVFAYTPVFQRYF